MYYLRERRRSVKIHARVTDHHVNVSGTDLGLLILRGSLGPTLVGHGAQKLGWSGPSRRQSEVEEFSALGYEPADVFVTISGFTEVISGILITAGLLTPLAATMLAGTASQATRRAKGPNGLWIQDDGYEYLLLIGGAALNFAFGGPGSCSLDARFQVDHSGRIAGLAAVAGAAIGLVLPKTLRPLAAASAVWNNRIADTARKTTAIFKPLTSPTLKKERDK